VNGGSLYLDEIYRQYLIVGFEDPLFLDVIDTSLVSNRRVLPPTENPFLRNLLIGNMQVSVAAGSWLRSREMDVEVSGDLVIDFDRLQSDLRMSGTLNALRGTYRLEYPPFARVFDVRSGSVEFPGTPGIDPGLNIEAVYRARTSGGEPLDIYAVVSGTLQAPRVHLRSDTEPPISESDLASYLFFGLPTYAFNFGSAGTGEAGVFGGLGTRALAASGLGYFASGLQTLAQNFNLVDYVGLTAAEASGSGATQAGLGGLLAGTRIELGRYVTPRLFVAYTQRLASENRGAGVRMEWRLTPIYTFEGFAEDRFARAPSFTLSQLISARKVYGFFLFREWGY
jgi:translocation and assembly module TamB